MINWLIIVIIAYFLNAVAAVVDKFLLTKKISQPAVYAFLVSVLSGIILLLIPISWFIPQFDFIVPSGRQIFISLLAGLTFTGALLYLYKALTKNDTSRIIPYVGGWQPFLIFILAFLFLGERLGGREILAFGLMLIGTIFITINLRSGKQKKRGGFGLAFIAAALFAISYVLTKNVYLNQQFLSGFIWIRAGTIVGGLLFLILPSNRQAIKQLFIKKPKNNKAKFNLKTKLIFLIGHTSGAISFIMINYAIAIASVSLIKAMEGLQYVFLLIMVWLLSKFSPRILREKMSRTALVQKIIAILLIGVGLCILAF